jgi:hypothetical protein
VPTKGQVKAFFRNPFVRTIYLGTATAGGFALFSCAGSKEAQTVQPVKAVEVHDVKGYEIKVGLGGADVKCTPTAADSASQVGISINNTGEPKNPNTYYFVPSKSDATALYGGKYWSAPMNTTTHEFAIGRIGRFGRNDTVNSGLVTSRQIMEFLTNRLIPNVSGGYVRLVEYPEKRLFVKEHTGYATQGDYVVNRNRNGLAGVWKGSLDYALWVLPEIKDYSVIVPFSIAPKGDASIAIDSNFFSYTSDGRRQIELAITEEKPVKPAALVRDYKYVSKPTGAAGYADEQAIVYTATDAIYVQDTTMKYTIGDTVFRKARGDMAIALGGTALDSCKIFDALGKPGKAGAQVVVTKTGVLATYYRLKQKDAKDTASSAAVQVPLTKYVDGLKVIEKCDKPSDAPGEDFRPVIGTGDGLFSFLTNVPGEKDTMQLRILRQRDGDVITLKMGMQGVSKITHSLKTDGTHVDVYGADGTVIGTVIIAKKVPYELIRNKNNILKDATSHMRTGELKVPFEAPYVPKEHLMYLLAGKYLPNGQLRPGKTSRFANRNRV